jgi:RimJ/RimL family protein N-acetyltransferase
MVNRKALADQAELHTEHLLLIQNGPEYFAEGWAALDDEDGRRTTGTHETFLEEDVRSFLARLPGADDRADWVVLRASDRAYLGEVVLNGLDEPNESMNFRISLVPEGRGKGYGTQATRAVVKYGLHTVGLHRISLDVHVDNPPAIRAYEKAGFVREGVLRDAVLWDGERIDEIMMAVLSTDPLPFD